MKNFLLIPMAGESSRFKQKAKENKLFYKVGKKTTFSFLLDTIKESSFLFEKIIFVLNKDYLEVFINDYLNNIKDKDFKNKIIFTLGGATRQLSVINGLNELENNFLLTNNSDANIIIHDAARFLIEKADLIKIVESINKEEVSASSFYSNLVDTTYIKNKQDNLELVDRSNYLRILTPQAFKLSKLKQYLLNTENVNSTDEFQLFIKNNEKYDLIQAGLNLEKITYFEDIKFIEKLLLKK